ncbi:fluoride efflux transporter FluC [Cryptosporangium sp. NPDC051539]|uniref:fluoride efflux transporter FluC n=1 Tax=Cryptosporangium sp. NPDC051539 TaxID=3363962 RepID=UPI0037B4BFFA
MSEPTMPADADVDLEILAQRREHVWPVLGAVSAGGVLGALARYGISTAWPHGPDQFAWSTLVVNVSGCFLIGVLMVVVTEVYPQRTLLRPFLGVGFLGGFTTFSTYVVDAGRNATAGAAAVGLVYLAVTVVAALVAVWAGSGITGWLVARR